MAVSTQIREHIRGNVWGILAVFIALGGTASALPGRNSVDSGDIRKGQVKLSDLATNSVDSSKVVDGSLTGVDVDESSLELSGLPPGGAAGGDLSGTYPNPQVVESGLDTGGDLSGPLSVAAVKEAELVTGGDLSGPLSSAAVNEAGLVTGGDLSGPLSSAAVSEAGLVTGGDLSGVLSSAAVNEAGLATGGDLSGPLSAAAVNESGLATGGDLIGVLSNAAITNNSIGVNEPSANANDEIVDGGIDAEDVQNNSLTATDIADTDTLGDPEIANLTRSYVIPASEIGPATLFLEASPPDICATNKMPAICFDQTTIEALDIITVLPADRAAGTNVVVRLHWSSTATGAAEFNLEFLSLGSGDAVNAAPSGHATVNSTSTPANTAEQADLQVSGFAAGTTGKLLLFRIYRDAGVGADTLADDAYVHAIEIRYTAAR